MTLTEALDACVPSDNGHRFALSFPNGSVIAMRSRSGRIVVAQVGDPDTNGSTREGGGYITPEYAERIFQFRPAICGIDWDDDADSE